MSFLRDLVQERDLVRHFALAPLLAGRTVGDFLAILVEPLLCVRGLRDI